MSLTTEQQLNIQVKKKESIFLRMQRLYDLSRKASKDPEQLRQFRAQGRNIESLRTEFIAVVDQINELSYMALPKFSPSFADVDSFEMIYCEVKDLMVLAEAKTDAEVTRGTVASSGYAFGAKLKPIDLPYFGGSPEEWVTFSQIFVKLVHENAAYTDVERVSYLLSHCTGSAKAVCTSIPATAENYQLIFNALKDRFEDKRALVSSYLEKILNFKALNMESEQALDNFLANFVEPVNALRGMNLSNLGDVLFLHVALKKLDRSTARAFESSKRSEKEIPAFDTLVEFVTEQAKVLSRIGMQNSNLVVKSNLSSSNVNKSQNKISHPVHSLLVREPAGQRVGRRAVGPQTSSACDLCRLSSAHPMYDCPEFKKMSVENRWEYARKRKICFNCCSLYHMASQCKSELGCRIAGCSKRHHSLLHRKIVGTEPVRSGPSETVDATVDTARDGGSSHAFCATSSSGCSVPSAVLLATFSVLALDAGGEFRELRGILDGGSESHFITRRACHRLGLKMGALRSVVKGIGTSPLHVTASAVIEFRSRVDTTQHYVANALVVERLSDRVPSLPISKKNLAHLEGLALADTQFHEPHEIDLLIGAELFPLILGSHKVSAEPGAPVAIETTLGYVVMGRAHVEEPGRSLNCFFAQPAERLESLVEKFWSLEEIPDRRILTREEEECEQFFLKTVVRNADGTFTVKLPFRQSTELLGSTLSSCIARFVSLERRLHRDPKMLRLYTDVVEGYIDDGTVSYVGSVPEEENTVAFYLPHHGVYRPDHPTTPLRIVFNASARSDSSYSLNQLLFAGPKLHTDIFTVLLHFRLYRYALTTDIRRMFLQIGVAKEDRRFQRFVWRSSNTQPMKIYEINKVVFGNTSSPYLANRVVQHLASLERKNFPLAAEVAKRDLYVDDALTSAPTEQDMIDAYEQLTGMFAAGGFTLTKWASNSMALMARIPEEDCLFKTVKIDPNDMSKVLGVMWTPHLDTLSCVVTVPDLPCTRRNILSITARLFDPLGFVAPVVLTAKLINKELSLKGIDWDSRPPQEVVDKWNRFRTSLPLLNKITMPRHSGILRGATTSLIGFADSSSKAYGACVYVRTCIPPEPPVVQLLCAKSRIAPSKVVTIPRLELCAALLLSKLMHTIVTSLASRHTFNSMYAFSDSKVVLHWINSDAARWKTFVSNRVAQIQGNLRAGCWRHVPGEENPADVLSRGATPSELLGHRLWFNGPGWILQEESQWPAAWQFDAADLPETETRVVALLAVHGGEENVLDALLERISSFRRLIRVTALVFRVFIRDNRGLPYILSSELKHAQRFWFKYVQSSTYSEDIARLQRGMPVTGSIRHLDPFLEGDLLRVGGRLSNAPLSFDRRHPILLPSKGRLVELLIEQLHIDLLHAGEHLLIASLRQEYWIPSARARVRMIVHRCNTCYRSRPRPTLPKMAPLPEFRVDSTHVFDRVGVDYAGPFSIVPHRRRGQRTLKAYFCVFVCLEVKAIHIELSSDLSTECFIAAFKRFLSRRGPCSMMLSDGGTNFIGARRQLGELERLIASTEYQTAVGDVMAARSVEWRINPPSAPWFGGIWEANVRSIKGLLRRLVGNQILTYEELNTALIQVEAVLNSRPLCVLSSDPNSPTALTPAHFLTPASTLRALPALDVTGVPAGRLSRYQLIDRLVQDFWKRWKAEYLNTLQSRAKWTQDTTPVNVGTIVVLMKDNCPPLQWPLGVIEGVHPGADGIVRVVDVRTQSGVYRRPVGRVCPLPTQ